MSAPGVSRRTPIRVMALIEATSPAGPARNLLILAKTLAEAGTARIRIVTFSRGQGSTPFIQACADMGVEADVIRERFRFDPVIPQLRAAAAGYAPDILQSHNIKSHLLVRLSGLRRTFPWIAFIHGYTAEDFKMKAYNQVDRWSLRAADRVVAVCGPFADKLSSWGVARERIMVRHNAVSEIPDASPEAVGRLRGTLGIGRGALVILAVGRLSPEKAHADLVRAVAALKGRPAVPDFRVVVAGDGPERERLQNLCRTLGVADVVILAGATNDIPLFYAMADVFVLPSHSEGSPNALLEAMIAGKPVVATAVGGVPEIVRDGQTGLLVAAHDTAAMAERLAELLADGERRKQLGESARSWVSSHHSREEYARSIVELYDGLLALRTRTACSL